MDTWAHTHTHRYTRIQASGAGFRLGPFAGWTMPGFGWAQCGLDPRGKEPGNSLSPGLPHGWEAGPEGGFGSPPPTGPPAGSGLVLRAAPCT